MATPHIVKPTSALSPQYVTGVYIPSALLLMGVAITKKEWLPFAAIVAALFGAYRIYSSREFRTVVSVMRLTRMIFRIKKSIETGCISKVPAQGEECTLT